MGKTGTQAQNDLKHALDATHDSAQAEQQALQPIIAIMQAAGTRANDISLGVQGITAATQVFGGTAPKEFQGAILKLAEMQGITEEQRVSLLGLTGDVKPDFEQLIGMADKYGVSLAALGPTFEQGHMDATAKQLFADFDVLKRSGGDVGGILSGMKDEVSALVQQSIVYGTAIPENMRPLIENLFDTGNLIDENGNKFEDMGQIKFEATPLDQGLSGLQAALDRLTATLQNMPAVAQGAASGMNSAFDGVSGPTFHTEGAATGGIVHPWGIQHFKDGGPVGTDTVPAWLTPGEVVLNQEQQRAVRGPSITVVVQGSLIAEADLIQKIHQSIASRVTLQTSLPLGVRV